MCRCDGWSATVASSLRDGWWMSDTAARGPPRWSCGSSSGSRARSAGHHSRSSRASNDPRVAHREDVADGPVVVVDRDEAVLGLDRDAGAGRTWPGSSGSV